MKQDFESEMLGPRSLKRTYSFTHPFALKGAHWLPLCTSLVPSIPKYLCFYFWRLFIPSGAAVQSRIPHSFSATEVCSKLLHRIDRATCRTVLNGLCQQPHCTVAVWPAWTPPGWGRRVWGRAGVSRRCGRYRPRGQFIAFKDFLILII